MANELVLCLLCGGHKTRVVKTKEGSEIRECFLCKGKGVTEYKVAVSFKKWTRRDPKKPSNS